ncbi:MAG TPA: FAD-binding oxidoreductase [Candidatus Paceibacterota bacterium]|nr:FAD-binding oxidoreductase [Candidatus Paceibacterota bacterium]
MNLQDELSKFITGEVQSDDVTLATYSHDASLFEVKPQVVVFPESAMEVQKVVKWVAEQKALNPELSITARSAGTDMSGGPLNESIILDFTKYINRIISVDTERGIVEPGCYYRDFEKETLKLGRLMPAYTASKEICAMGGMVANNSGGEKSIKYGKVENYVRWQKVIFSDGNAYEVKPLNQEELKLKMEQNDFEGYVYKKLFKLIEANYDAIQAAKPKVNKNSAGYYLWNVWDRETGVFDLNKLLVGAQGTLALTTEIEFGLVPVQKHSRMVVVFMNDIERLGGLVDTVMQFKPESLESYDDYSMKLAIKFAFDFFKQLGFFGALKLGFQFIPDMLKVITGGVPKLIMMVEITGDDEEALYARCVEIQKAIAPFNYQSRIAGSKAEVEKYWKIRRESFNLLRKHVKGKRTAPFIDDIVVTPHDLPKFFPELQKILGEYKLIYTIAGHAGNGNFHIIPLMDLDNPLSADVILELSDKVYRLVAQYGGSTTAEHNDGIIRTPYLSYIFNTEIINLFAEVKRIFDPQNIFNPGKKVGGSFDYIRTHLIKSDRKVAHGS